MATKTRNATATPLALPVTYPASPIAPVTPALPVAVATLRQHAAAVATLRATPTQPVATTATTATPVASTGKRGSGAMGAMLLALATTPGSTGVAGRYVPIKALQAATAKLGHTAGASLHAVYKARTAAAPLVTAAKCHLPTGGRQEYVCLTTHGLAHLRSIGYTGQMPPTATLPPGLVRPTAVAPTATPAS